MTIENIIIENIRKYACQWRMHGSELILLQITTELLLPIAEDIINQMKKEGYLDNTRENS